MGAEGQLALHYYRAILRAARTMPSKLRRGELTDTLWRRIDELESGRSLYVPRHTWYFAALYIQAFVHFRRDLIHSLLKGISFNNGMYTVLTPA
jgi:hypothetical protein